VLSLLDSRADQPIKLGGHGTYVNVDSAHFHPEGMLARSAQRRRSANEMPLDAAWSMQHIPVFVATRRRDVGVREYGRPPHYARLVFHRFQPPSGMRGPTSRDPGLSGRRAAGNNRPGTRRPRGRESQLGGRCPLRSARRRSNPVPAGGGRSQCFDRDPDPLTPECFSAPRSRWFPLFLCPAMGS
jgi:hypothetical protein